METKLLSEEISFIFSGKLQKRSSPYWSYIQKQAEYIATIAKEDYKQTVKSRGGRKAYRDCFIVG